MNWKILFTQMSALGAFSPERLATLQALSNNPTPDVDALLAEVVTLFEDLQGRGNQSGEVAASMSLLASAAERNTTPLRRPSLAEVNASQQRREPARSRPRAARRSFGGAALTASGVPLDSRETLASELTRAVHASASGPALLFRSTWSYPEERQLGADPYSNAAKVDAVCGPQALVASGGICNPVNVDYTLPVFASDERPLRDSLPGFQASRGGIRYATTPSLEMVGAAGTTVWTNATDTVPGGSTKPVFTISCGQEVEVFVDAIPTRVQMGNMQARFSPEYVEAILANVTAAAARVAELHLLTKISAVSTVVSASQLLGATRDLLPTLDLVAAAYRDRHRLSDASTLRVLMPRWVRDMVRADLARELAHGRDADNLVLSNTDVTALLTGRGLAVTWLLDGLGPQATGITYPAQGFGEQTSGAVMDWPRQVSWHLFAEGSMQFLDGGSLTVSVVQDSTLNNTNQREFFTETFEAVANRGSRRCKS